MPVLIDISKRYGLSKDLTGLVVAIGNLIPEAATTFNSFTRPNIQMTEFGMATNIGCAAFSITMAPAIAVFFL